MTRLPLNQKVANVARYCVGVCVTPILVVGVASVAATVFVLDKVDRMSTGRKEKAEAASAQPTWQV